MATKQTIKASLPTSQPPHQT